MHCDFDFMCLFITNTVFRCLNLECSQLTFSVNVSASYLRRSFQVLG